MADEEQFDREDHERCPNCGAPIIPQPAKPDHYDCPACKRCFRMIVSQNTCKVAFLEETVEPLFIPKGSIRAVTILTLSLSCWILMLRGVGVPPLLFSIITMIIAYYFGFRKRTKEAGAHTFSNKIRVKQPLFLPSGVIRFVLAAGFLLVGAYHVVRMGGVPMGTYSDFFTLLAGLITGYLFGRFILGDRHDGIPMLINHLKGALVLLADLLLLVLFIFAPELLEVLGLTVWYSLTLAGALVISFYFGSRS